MRYQRLFSEIAGLSGLRFEHDVPIEYSDERRQGLLITVDAATFLDPSQADKQDAEDGRGVSGREVSVRQEERLFRPVDKSITDLLGDYRPEQRKIIIYK